MKQWTTKFEGPEKKLEIILCSPWKGLRSNSQEQWDRVVRASNAEVISKVCTAHLDAYLLSESSLFVWDDRILIITCGKTTLIQAVPEILRIVGKANIAFVFYGRKSFMFPTEQPSNFEDDVAFMLRYFSGKSYRLGPANDDHMHMFYAAHAPASIEPDATLEVLMHDLECRAVEVFSFNRSRTVEEIDTLCGLNGLYPQMDKDRHLFSPYGYSVNGVFDAHYFTVHVTPQPEGSYASFETNVMEPDYSERIDQVLSIFNPKRFSIVLTTSMAPGCRPLHATIGDVVPDYFTAEKTVCEFNREYAMTFLNYVRQK